MAIERLQKKENRFDTFKIPQPLPAQDTQETITTIRRLKSMGIGVYVELGGINTLTTPDSIIDMYAVFDQAESQERSDSIKFGIRRACAVEKQF